MKTRTIVGVGLVAMLGGCTTEAPDPAEADLRLVANVSASDIRVLRDLGEEHPAPEVLPRLPLHLVIDDCDGLKGIPPNDHSDLDTENKVFSVSWADPGVGGENRSLTILYASPSCSEHPSVRLWLK